MEKYNFAVIYIVFLIWHSAIVSSQEETTGDPAPAPAPAPDGPTPTPAPTPDPLCFTEDPDNPEKTVFMDCTVEEYAAEDKTDCCEIDGAVGCCRKGARFDAMRNMLIGIGVGTFCLALLLFILMWCNRKTFPCIGRYQDRASEKYEEFEESLSCCESRVEKRRKQKAEKERQAKIPEYEMPSHLQQEVQDDFWGSP